jgi:WD40 repeat protein
VLVAHRAAINAVSIDHDYIVSASGDRSIMLWDANTGKLLRTLENHHTRGFASLPYCAAINLLTLFCRIASIDFKFPYILSGSSDKHLRLFDLKTQQGWSTCNQYDFILRFVLPSFYLCLRSNSNACHTCGTPLSMCNSIVDGIPSLHADLVRSVVIGEEFVLSGSYDMSIKVW